MRKRICFLLLLLLGGIMAPTFVFGSGFAISFIYGVTFNVVFNTVMFVLLAAPLIFTRQFFTKKDRLLSDQ